ncbi:hypothetical protein [Alteromonas genovensis]|nr:hypothetical protein [Alteromonas genovensis]
MTDYHQLWAYIGILKAIVLSAAKRETEAHAVNGESIDWSV